MPIEGAASQQAKPDPNVQLPAAVRRAAERSEELARQAAEARQNAPPNANEPLRIANPPSVPNSGGQEGVTVARFDPNNPRPPEEGQLSVVQLHQQPQQQPTPPENQQPTDWEHQFKSLQGRYAKAEQDTKRMSGQINDMQRLIASLNAPPPPRQDYQQGQYNPSSGSTDGQGGSGVRFSGPIAGRPPPRRVTEKEISDYGADLVDVMGRRAMEVADSVLMPQFQRYDDRLAQLERQIGGVRQTVAYDGQSRMYDILKQEVPNWTQINDSPDFVRWLSMPEPLSGQIRHNMLIEAFNGQQTKRVVEFFKHYLADQAPAGLQGYGQQPGNYPTINSGGTPQVDLVSLAAPGRAKTGQSQVTPERPIVERAEISQFYRDKAMGRYAGREAETARIEQEIFAASREGRIR